MKKMNSSLLPTSYGGNVNKKSKYLLKKFEVEEWMLVFAGKTGGLYQFLNKKERAVRRAADQMRIASAS